MFRGALLAALVAAWSGLADADPGAPVDAPSDSAGAPAVLRVASLPSGLTVLVDSLLVGRTPIDSLLLAPGTVRVRVLAADPRRFDTARDAVVVTLRSGVTTSVLLDVRPSVLLRSEPEPVSVLLVRGAAGSPDTLLGETPLSVRPSVIENGLLRFSRAAYVDTVLPAASIAADSSTSIRVRLSRGPGLAAPPPPMSHARPVYRKAWFQWSLITIGVALSGAAVALHHQGDDAYDLYLKSSDVSEIPDLYDEAARYDRWAAASLVVGQVCFVGGLVLLATGQR